MATATASGSLRFYKADVVSRKVGSDDEHKIGMVSRCYHDELDQDPTTFNQIGLDRALKENEYGILWMPSGHREIVLGSTLNLIDRIFAVGSNCKRSLGDAAAGVVTSLSTTLKLQHLFSREEIDHMVPADDVVKGNLVNHGDHVIADDWIGEIDGMVEEGLIANSDNDRLIRVCELGGRLLLGKIPEELMKSDHLGINLARLGLKSASIVDIKQTVFYVNWLALNQKLTPDQQAKRPKPPALCTDFSKLTLVKAFSQRNHEIGDRVVFRNQQLKDQHGAKYTHHGRERLAIDAMLVMETCTELEVMWQDGSRTKEKAVDMVPHLNLDEHESWPGDWVYWKSDEHGSVPRVVQKMDPLERTAELRKPFSEPAEVELVPSLEIDVQGPDHSVFSLHRGDAVMISGRSTGFSGPFLPTVGDPRPDYSDMDLQNDLMNAEMNIVPNQGTSAQEIRYGTEATEIDWYGTVEELLLDGSCQIRLPCGKQVTEKLERLQILSDTGFGMHEHEHEDDDGMIDVVDPWDGMEEDDGYYDDDYDSAEEAMWMDQDGEVVANTGDDWEDMDDGSNGALEVAEIHLDDAEADEDAAEAAHVDASSELRSVPATTKTQNGDAGTSKATSSALEAIASTEASSGEPSAPSELAAASSDREWSQFSVLESAPTSHAFYSKPPASAPGATFFKRLQKEMKVLQTSLPETILVRAYEDRSDLLRVLIIGSEGTPYENAPFLLDFQLTEEFPTKPPVAHFHSWTNGHGRVSPNLYEDGKVCLSVLGTWSGVAEENWTPSKSSLLQVFVSIQALVLVREPYFTEPAYEKLKGKDESKVNSRLYNEKAYILSRGFVRKALEQPPEGFATELELFYHKAANLRKIVERAEALMNATPGADSAPSEDEAVHGLTKGGGIMLGRTITALKTLLKPSA